MCASAGRESSLREPSHYKLRFPHVLVSLGPVATSPVPTNFSQAPEDPKQAFTSHMVALAHLMDQLSQEIYQSDDPKSLAERSSKCLDIDRQLIQWKGNLPVSLDFDRTSLTEPEWVAKQKVVLRNRKFREVHNLGNISLTWDRLLELSNSDPPAFPDSCGYGI